MPLIIDGKSYQVEVASLTRQIDIIEKYRELTEDSIYHREIEGVYHHYNLEIGNISPVEYDQLIEALSTYKEYVTVTLPSKQRGNITFKAMVENMTDAIITEDEYGVYWDNLMVTFTAKEPIKE